MSASIFDIKNDGASDLLLYLEPEGNEFRLPPQEPVQVHLAGSGKTIKMQQTVDVQGRICISLWPCNGSYELFFKGASVWDLL